MQITFEIIADGLKRQIATHDSQNFSRVLQANGNVTNRQLGEEFKS